MSENQRSADLRDYLLKQCGAERGDQLFGKYVNAFDYSYAEESSPEMTRIDIARIEGLAEDRGIDLYFYRLPEMEKNFFHLRLYTWRKSIPLFQLLPMLENCGFRIWGERSYCVSLGEAIWISDMVVFCENCSAIESLQEMEPLYRDALQAMASGEFAVDKLNELILTAGLTWREITALRAYVRYMLQTDVRFSQSYIENCIVSYPQLAKLLLELFLDLHDPAKVGRSSRTETLEGELSAAVEQTRTLDDDIIFRYLLALIKATLRTNYFHSNSKGFKPYLSFKFFSAAIPSLPLPVPLYELFVYSERFEAIHLRAAAVARGGIRWSDRREDFRREVHGLMKAQKVKNAIIVPSGAKGGFVLKAQIPPSQREQLQKEGTECYQLFMRALLEITDNIVEERVIRPENTVCHDEEDTYLVVAADKGTANFSDLANSIAAEYNFWLDDAFASGGKTGYNHKDMGITARGAWESVKRHFRHLDIDINTMPISAVGIGDMSGDVFGNGMLYTRQLQLLAAFDHRHIFLDPNPDPERSYAERRRLFHLARSSWADYDAQLISPGGGIFSRNLKAIPITPEVKERFEISEDRLTPNELIRALLKAQVDLLWFGGIGTYVKAQSESYTEVGDKANEALCINGSELRCRVVGEGANLGITQKGRIEYALNGGLIFTDFIDNSAGVDCSDHEVNLKILLHDKVVKGDLNIEERNQLLMEVTDDVAALVLKNNNQQAWILSFLAQHGSEQVTLYQNYMKELEKSAQFNRKAECLPDEKQLTERKAAKIGLTRPELSVLLAYTKIYLKGELLKSDLLEQSFISYIIQKAFPQKINAMYGKVQHGHILHREIIATQLLNRVVNDMGALFVYRLQLETDAPIVDIIRAYTFCSSIFDSHQLVKQIKGLDFKVPVERQYEFYGYVNHLINISTRWFLNENRFLKGPEETISHYSAQVKLLKVLLMEMMTGVTQTFNEELCDYFAARELPEGLATDIAFCRVAYSALNIIEGASLYQIDLAKMAHLYFAVGEHFNLVWFRDQLIEKEQEQAWDFLARLTLRDELDRLQKALTVIMAKSDTQNLAAEEILTKWLTENREILKRWNRMVIVLQGSESVNYSMLFVALNKLADVVKKSSL